MQKLFVIILFLFATFSSGAQSIDWYELVLIPELKQANFLVRRIDSVKKKCERAGEARYCTEAEYAHDYKVESLRKQQIHALKKVDLNCCLIGKGEMTDEEENPNKYRYVIDYDYDLIGIEEPKTSAIYLKLDFLLIDRQTGKIIARSMQPDLQHPFTSLELMLAELKEMNELK